MTDRIAPQQEWWTAAEIAASGLPDLPTTKQAVNRLISRQCWHECTSRAQKRGGQGGGWEYSWKLFPFTAQLALLKRAAPIEAPASRPDRNAAWAVYDSLPQSVKDKALYRLGVIQKVEEMTFALTKFLAVNEIARAEKIAPRTIWNWFEMIEFVDRADRLPFLAPRHRITERKLQKVEIDPNFWEYLKGTYLRLEGPSFTASYDVTVKIAKAQGWPIPHPRTARRRMDTLPRTVVVYKREGMRGLEKCFPPQIRDRSQMMPMEGVNADFHKLDFAVEWPGIEGWIRPQVIGFQDLYSNKMLSWRYDANPNKVATMSAFGEMVETYGIPGDATFDNGKEFANKWLTGGTETRFTFKVKDDEPIGVLPLLGIRMHFATPYHGQAKPIERAWREIAERVSKDPRLAGAYLGNKPDAKPENYGERVIPFEVFRQVVDEGILDYNARQGRLTASAKGRSFDETFAEAYERTPIRKATEEQRRLWLLGQEERVLNRNHGRFKIFDAHYWSDWMTEYAGQKVVGRFDPLDLNAGLYIYSLDGKFLGFAECEQKAEYYDYAEAKNMARKKSAFKKQIRQQAKEIVTVDVEQVAAALDAAPKPELQPLEAKIVKLAQMTQHERGPLVHRPMPVPDQDAALEAKRAAAVLEFKPDANASAKVERPEDAARARFQKAIDIETRSAAGERIGEGEADWLQRYQTTPEYRSRKWIWEEQGGQFAG